jgi:hypothetical protein
MIYLFPTAMLIGGIACIATGQAFAGVMLCFFGALLFEKVVEKDKE